MLLAVAARILMADGRDVTVSLSAKRAAEIVEGAMRDGSSARLALINGNRVWVNPEQIAAIEELADR